MFIHMRAYLITCLHAYIPKHVYNTYMPITNYYALFIFNLRETRESKSGVQLQQTKNVYTFYLISFIF